MPRISLIMPTYRRPHYARQALESVRRQDFQDYEVLVCDNGADEATETLVSQFADPRFRYFPREHNLGMLPNAMLGFSQADSPVVMKLDDDDLLLPGALQHLLHPFDERPDLGMSFGGVTLIDDVGSPREALTRSLDEQSGRGVLREGFIQPATGLVARGGVQLAGAAVRAELFEWAAVPESVATAYDLYMALRAVEEGRAAHFTPERVVEYRVHPGSDTTLRQGQQLQAACEVLEMALSGGHHGEVQDLERRLADTTLDAARILARDGRAGQSRSRALQSLRLRPSRAAARLIALSYAPSRVGTRVAGARARRFRKDHPAPTAPV